MGKMMVFLGEFLKNNKGGYYGYCNLCHVYILVPENKFCMGARKPDPKHCPPEIELELTPTFPPNICQDKAGAIKNCFFGGCVLEG